MYNHPTTQNKAINQSELTDKKLYHTPNLSHFGNVKDLTKSNSPTGANTPDDGGTPPNFYNS